MQLPQQRLNLRFQTLILLLHLRVYYARRLYVLLHYLLYLHHPLHYSLHLHRPVDIYRLDFHLFLDFLVSLVLVTQALILLSQLKDDLMAVLVRFSHHIPLFSVILDLRFAVFPHLIAFALQDLDLGVFGIERILHFFNLGNNYLIFLFKLFDFVLQMLVFGFQLRDLILMQSSYSPSHSIGLFLIAYFPLLF